jgi:hypothetical protein
MKVFRLVARLDDRSRARALVFALAGYLEERDIISHLVLAADYMEEMCGGSLG